MPRDITKSKTHKALSDDGSGLPSRQKYAPHERDAVHEQKMRLAERAKIGSDWDGAAANDNQNWPLAKALLSEGNTELLKYAIAYRKIHETANSDVAIGINHNPSPDTAIAHRSRIDGATGKIIYGAEIVSKSGSVDLPPMRATPTNPDSKKRASPVPKPWTGDRHINDKIDARTKLQTLQNALGPILEPFEMMVIDGATLMAAGQAAYATKRGAMSAGRSIAHMGLIRIRHMLGGIGREQLAA